MTKICKQCKKELPLTDFYLANKKSYRSKCKICYGCDAKYYRKRTSVYPLNCVVCGNIFKVQKHKLESAKYCSYSCRGKAHKGDQHWNWKGGKILLNKKSDYIYILQPEHPFAINLEYVAEHWLVMERKINQLLKPYEIIHHLNRIVADNRIENLEMTTFSDHTRFHNLKRSKKRKERLCKI